MHRLFDGCRKEFNVEVLKPYRVYADEGGYRSSCRVRGCAIGTSTGWNTREAAEEAGKDHYEKAHNTERDRDLENWVKTLQGG